MASNADAVMDALASDFRGITVGNGYNNTVATVVKAIRDPKNIMAFPEIGLEFGDSTFRGDDIDSNWSIFNEYIDVHVVGYVRSDLNAASSPEDANKLQALSESFCHDIKKKICTDILKTNIDDSSNPWNVELADGRLVIGRVMFFGEQRSIGMLYTKFVVKIRNQSSSFE